MKTLFLLLLILIQSPALFAQLNYKTTKPKKPLVEINQVLENSPHFTNYSVAESLATTGQIDTCLSVILCGNLWCFPRSIVLKEEPDRKN